MPPQDSTSETKRSPDREGLKVGGTILVLLLVGFGAAYQFVGPPPPRRLILATGVDGGGYHAAGVRYVEVLERSGIELALLPTAGSLENLEALRSGAADVALVQGGTAGGDAADFAEGIASVFFEPLWIFHRSDLAVERLSDLAARRILVGSEGSGTRAVANELLAANGIGAGDVELLDQPASTAPDVLLSGAADAAFLVMAPQSETIARLMDAEGAELRLFDVERHLAYVRNYSYLAHVVLGEGALDLARNVPDREIDLVAPTAFLAGRDDLHPALVPLLVQAAEEVHGAGDLMAAPGSFPSEHNLDLTLSAASSEYFANGSSFLYRVFPFPVAATLDRLKIMLLPLLTLLFPLFRVAPPVYRWRIRRKIYRWYRNLEDVEARFAASAAQRDRCLRDLDEVEREVVDTDVPASHMEELHNLRMHIDRARARVRGEV
ncbi:MAG: TAXI family TRAP transporter solute-binding subunit [Planctomycetota bacterium]